MKKEAKKSAKKTIEEEIVDDSVLPTGVKELQEALLMRYTNLSTAKSDHLVRRISEMRIPAK
jgi:hypothetical protein